MAWDLLLVQTCRDQPPNEPPTTDPSRSHAVTKAQANRLNVPCIFHSCQHPPPPPPNHFPTKSKFPK